MNPLVGEVAKEAGQVTEDEVSRERSLKEEIEKVIEEIELREEKRLEEENKKNKMK